MRRDYRAVADEMQREGFTRRHVAMTANGDDVILWDHPRMERRIGIVAADSSGRPVVEIFGPAEPTEATRSTAAAPRPPLATRLLDRVNQIKMLESMSVAVATISQAAIDMRDNGSAYRVSGVLVVASRKAVAMLEEFLTEIGGGHDRDERAADRESG